jgi:OmpA-OmpF porin, OOP family
MSVKIQIFFLLIILGNNKILSQDNLVQNYSFENLNGVDTFYNVETKKLNTVQFPKFWRSPSRTNKAQLINGYKPEEQGCPVLQKAKSGKQMISIVTFSPAEERWHSPWDAQSYVQGELKEPLQVGKKYDVELWVIARDTALNACFDKIHTFPSVIFVYSNNIGVLFTEDHFYYKRVLDTIPQINESKMIVTSDGNWYKISGSFVADKPYKVLTIGNFYKGLLTETSLSEDNRPKRIIEDYRQTTRQRGAIYYLDDIKVVLSKDQPTPLIIGQSLIIENIFFENGKAELLPNSFASLDNLFITLKKSNFKNIEIQGHTDNTGTESQNLKLSEERAIAVYNYLVAHGISKGKLNYKGFGHSQPLAPNTSIENKQKNRRVEIKIKE